MNINNQVQFHINLIYTYTYIHVCVCMFFCGEVLLVELVPAVCQTGSLYNTHFHLLLDTSFEFWQKATHQAASIEMSSYIHE